MSLYAAKINGQQLEVSIYNAGKSFSKSGTVPKKGCSCGKNEAQNYDLEMAVPGELRKEHRLRCPKCMAVYYLSRIS